MRNFIEEHKAQMTIVAILMVFITLIVYFAMLPALNSLITNATENTSSPYYIAGEMERFVVRLIPLLILLSIVTSIFIYTQPTYGGG